MFNYQHKIYQRFDAVEHEGIYTFEVKEAIEHEINRHISNLMELHLKIAYRGKFYCIRDYLKAPWKIRNFFVSIGEPQLFKGKNDKKDFVKKKGKALIFNDIYKNIHYSKVKNYVR